MKIEWKKSKKLKPEVILKKIHSVMTVTAEGKVSFHGFEYHDAVAALQTMISYPENIAWMSREIFISKAIAEAARSGSFDSNSVIFQLNRLLDEKLEQREQTYYLLTSISFAPPLLATSVNIGSCKIRFYRSRFPRKFISRTNFVAEVRRRGFDNKIDANPDSYTKVVVSIKSKSADWAANDCIKSLDILRAIWCLSFNSSMEIIGDEWSPINKVRLGGVHTVHREDGSLAFDTFWFEPNFVIATPYQVSPSALEKRKKYCADILKKVEASRYSNTLSNALVRYVRALDEKNQNAAFIRLWGAMEELLSPNGANYDLAIKRCAFLFQEHEYHRQLLEHLREYRNSNVHAGEQSEKAKGLCFQLQFYFYHLVIFHLRNVAFFESLDQANEFLDLSLDVNVLKKRKKMIQKAIRFISPME